MILNQIEVAIILGLPLTLFIWLFWRSFSRLKQVREENQELHRKLAEKENAILELTPPPPPSRDAALATTTSKSELLANISHEIRTPLSFIISISTLLLNTELARNQRQSVEAIRVNSKNLLAILDDLLDFSKIEAGKLRFENIKFDLRYVLSGVTELLGESARAKGVKLTALIDKNVPTALCGDPGRLRQVLTNLVGNAVKFTSQGSVRVRVNLKSETNQKVVIRFSVEDTGIGVPEEARHLLFKPFMQADSSVARNFGGTGLGLSISKYLVENMGGEIGVNFPNRRGSEFWFTASLEKQHKANYEQSSLALNGGLTGLRVLVVDGDENSRRNLMRLAESWDMHVFEANSTQQALKILRNSVIEKEPFDFVLLEKQLPDMDSFSFARIIKADEDLARTRVILLPSITERGHGLLARESGFAAYLPKPVISSQLFECLVNLSSDKTKEESEKSDADVAFITRHTLAEIKQQISNAARRAQILIVEDNEIAQEVLTNLVRLLGFEPDVAAGGFEAVRLLDEKKYEFILMDCLMPGLNGYETTKRIRAGEGVNKHTPIIAVTARALEEERKRCLDAGMNDYLVKPVEKEDLQNALRERNLKKTNGHLPQLTARQNISEQKQPPVDLQRLVRLSGSKGRNLHKFIDNYLDKMSENLSRLDAAIHARSVEQVEHFAHNCVGISALYGVNLIIPTLRELENLSRSDNLNSASELHTRIMNEFEEVRIYLKDQLIEELYR